MIRSERQYQTTRSELAKFEAALASYDDQPRPRDVHPLIWEAGRRQIEGDIAQLKGELREYDALRGGAKRHWSLSRLGELAHVLIAARIAQHLTQEQLGGRVGLAQQQVQRYEANDYDGLDLERAEELAEALGLTIHIYAALPGAAQSEDVRNLLQANGSLARQAQLVLDAAAQPASFPSPAWDRRSTTAELFRPSGPLQGLGGLEEPSRHGPSAVPADFNRLQELFLSALSSQTLGEQSQTDLASAQSLVAC